jgi:glycosyltransferase involved in cell wall biosynthesis
MRLSIIIPAYNEAKNLVPLLTRLRAALPITDYEILIVNDGSADNSRAVLEGLEGDPIHVLHLPEHMGKSYALFQGIHAARGQYIITMDADLQDDPQDIIPILLRLESGYDAVYGVRRSRRDTISKRLQSYIANTIANLMLSESYRDRACGLKGFRKEAVQDLRYFSGMHRFFPTLLRACRTCEMAVNHRPRLYGKSKYGPIRRALGTFLDLLYVKGMRDRGHL